jgi:hypothetical protein
VNAIDRPDFNPYESVLSLSGQLDANQMSNLPMDTVFIQTPDLNMSYNPGSIVVAGQRLVYLLNSEVVAEARYYPGWKGIISTDGTGDGNMIVYQSPLACPYLSHFPQGFENWSSYDSTLVYVVSSTPLKINSITADGSYVNGQAWWRTGTSWTSGWPITIPPNEDVIIQVAGKAKSISIQTDNGSMTIPVADGQKDPLTILDPSQTRISTPNSAYYMLAIYKSAFGNGNLTVKIDDHRFNVNLNQNQSSEPNFSYIGPVYLAGGTHTISISRNNITISQMDGILIYSLDKGESFLSADNLLSSTRSNNSSIRYQKISPVQYSVNVNSSNAFYLVFSETYDKGWVASIDGQQISAQDHFTANGYANCWYINKTGSYSITLEFTPQRLFYVGVVVSIATLIVFSVYIGIKIVSKSKNLNAIK